MIIAETAQSSTGVCRVQGAWRVDRLLQTEATFEPLSIGRERQRLGRLSAMLTATALDAGGPP
jgi:hypothetical protein